jgi:4-diphosphocytidyl-2-C-methyl-D-erythritol kinase
MLTITAPAKINLVLEVLGKRPDNFHEIRSIVQAVTLSDYLGFKHDEKISLKGDRPGVPDADNLVYRAAVLLKQRTGYAKGVRIFLEKYIPVAGGLGGGSSDAAATILALNKLWELNLGNSEMTAIAAELGSDVAFFITSGTALMEGRGEKITPLDDFQKFWYVILAPHLPEVAGKTGIMYSLMDKNNYSDGGYVELMLEKWRAKDSVKPSICHNAFDPVGLKTFPALDKYWNSMVKADAKYVHLAGSGPSLFCAFETEAGAKDVYANLKEQKYNVFLAETC